MPKIELTISQIDNLMEFIEFSFIPSIRDSTDVDNIDYLVDMCAIYSKLRIAKEKASEGRNDGV